MNTTRTIVAIDEGTAGDAALDWTIRRAHWAKDPVLLVHVVEETTLVPGKVLDPQRYGRARALLDAAASKVRSAGTGVGVRTKLITGDVVPSLTALTAPDALLVVGENSRRSVRSSMGWSAAVRVASHASGPVAVVPADVRDERRGVVVGVDDTPDCMRVAEVAAHEALTTGQALHIVHAWAAPTIWLDTFPLDDEFMAELAKPHEQLLADIVGTLRGEHPSLDVTGSIVHGLAARSLLDADPLPTLVVVGTRGKSVFQRLRLGSVSRDLLLNLDVPAIVVPTATAAPAPEPTVGASATA